MANILDFTRPNLLENCNTYSVMHGVYYITVINAKSLKGRRFNSDLIFLANERVYLILKTTVRLSHPAPMDLILRKRLGLNIYKRQSFTDRIRKKIVRSVIFE